MDNVIKPHWFRPSSTTRVPRLWCFWYALPRFVETSSGHRTAKLACVSGQVCTIRSGKIRTDDALTTIDPEHFHAWLLKWTSRKSTLQAVTYWLTAGASMLGMWDRMRMKEWTVHDPRGPRPSRKDPTKNANPSHGFVVTADPPAILQLWHRSGVRVNWLDIRNYCDKDIHELSFMVGSTLHPWDEGETDLCGAAIACEQRTGVLRDFVYRMVSEWTRHGMGQWRPSLGGLATSSFRVLCPDRTILVDRDCLATKICRESYYGGETRSLHVGRVEGPIYEVDMNAAYAWSMASGRHPVMHQTNMREPSVSQLEGSARLWWVAAVVKIEDSPVAFPVRRHGLVRYCVGSYWTALCGDDLTEALRIGVVKRVLCAAVYSTGKPFGMWVDARWRSRMIARESGDRVAAWFHKSLGNGLYGRWAMRASPWKDRPDVPPRQAFGRWTEIDDDDDTVRQMRAIGWSVQERQEPEEHMDAVPAIAGSVTAKVRKEMRFLLNWIGPTSVHWQCVDCFHINSEGMARVESSGLLDPSMMGKLSQKAVYQWVEYHGPYDLRLPDGHKTAGLARDAIQASPCLWTQWTGPGMDELLGRGGPGGYEQVESCFTSRDAGRLATGHGSGEVARDAINSDDLPRNLSFDIWEGTSD